ncbi:MAG: TonB-dependent receptor [Acidobacteriota bacterium]|nr:TonB-dependent receptor [Acidobacteriota bacterium]
MLRVIAVVCVFGSTASAQGVDAQLRTLSGVVVDQNGAPVAGASVTVREAGSSTEKRGTTDAQGRFNFDSAPSGGFVLTVEARGFERFERRLGAGGGSAEPLRVVLAPAAFDERVTVTASRTETRLGETAASVVILSSEEIESTAALTADDALRQVPGFQLFRRTGSRAANPTAQGVSLRGVGASGASRAVVLYDGVPLNDPFGGWVYWGRVPREGLERIEVLRGGASSLYGSGAVGGVVQFVPRRPDNAELRLETSYGSQNTPDASVYAGARRGPYAFALAAQDFGTGGYVLTDRAERGRVDTPAASREAAGELYVAREFGFGPKVFARASYYGESRRNGTPLQFNRTHLRQLAAGADWNTPRAGDFALRTYASTEVFDQSFTSVSADRNTETLTRLQRVPAQVFGLSFQWSRPFGARSSFAAGFEAGAARGASDELVYAAGRATSLVGAGGRWASASLYARDILRLTPRLIITPGARLDRWNINDGRQTTRTLTRVSPNTVVSFTDRVETAFSPQLSALYKLSERVSLTSTFTRAFRAPTLNELYRSFRVGNVFTLANSDLRAERLTDGEAGAIFNARGGRLAVRANAFWMDVTRAVSNVTLSVTPSLITRQRQNLGRTRSRGFEAEAEARLGGHWTLSGGYLLSDARVARFPADISLEGLRVPQVAREQAAFELRYTNPARFAFGIQARAAGPQFDDDQNLLRLRGYFTLDALISRRLARGVEAFVAAENLTGRRYEAGRTPVLTLGPPLFVRAGLRLRLGAR